MRIIPPQIAKRFVREKIFYIKNGWLSLVEDLDEELAKISENYKLHEIISLPHGPLCVGIDPKSVPYSDRKEFDSIISEYVDKSLKTCNICSKPGRKCSFSGDIEIRCENHTQFLNYDNSFI